MITVPLETAVSPREAEELFMADDEVVRARIASLVDARWQELLAGKTPVSRRARTMGTCAALRETVQLAMYARSAADEGAMESRGERMLPDVADEAEDILRNDVVLEANRALKESIAAALVRPEKGAPSDEWIQQLTSLLSHLEAEYMDLAVKSLGRHFTDAKPSLVSFEMGLEHLAAHGRGLGWSDEALTLSWESARGAHADPLARITQLCETLRTAPADHRCSVRIKLGDTPADLFHLPERGIAVRQAEALTHMDVTVRARDPWAAARGAVARVSAVVGAPNVFQDLPNSLDGGRVQVEIGGRSIEVDALDRVLRDHHNPRRDQIKRIVDVASRASGHATDTLYDAVRNHQRALTIPDSESAFVLLWAALERLCANPDRPEPILAATADLISGAIAFSKVRREVGNLSEELTRQQKESGAASGLKLHEVDHNVIRSERSVVSHDDILKALVGTKDEAKVFCAAFYEDVRLTQWFFRLRQQLASQEATSTSLAKRLPKLIEGSRRRTRWQVLRLYRARNFLAHGASHPQWLNDLARHAHYLLTNALAICLNYSTSGERSAKDMLKQRCGWLDAYLRLVRNGEPRAVSIGGMLKPSQLFS